MRTLTLKYQGDCVKCGATLEAGEQGGYEKRVGVFCVPCTPTDSEEIRSYRQAGADRKAEKYEEWAGKRRENAEAVLNPGKDHYSHDWAFITQPGRIVARERWNAKTDRALESLQVAQRMERKAESLREVRVTGDTERKRQAEREANDERFSKGSRIFTSLHGAGVIVSVHKKSYRVKNDRGYTCSVDKSWARPA